MQRATHCSVLQFNCIPTNWKGSIVAVVERWFYHFCFHGVKYIVSVRVKYMSAMPCRLHQVRTTTPCYHHAEHFKIMSREIIHKIFLCWGREIPVTEAVHYQTHFWIFSKDTTLINMVVVGHDSASTHTYQSGVLNGNYEIEEGLQASLVSWRTLLYLISKGMERLQCNSTLPHATPPQ